MFSVAPTFAAPPRPPHSILRQHSDGRERPVKGVWFPPTVATTSTFDQDGATNTLNRQPLTSVRPEPPQANVRRVAPSSVLIAGRTFHCMEDWLSSRVTMMPPTASAGDVFAISAQEISPLPPYPLDGSYPSHTETLLCALIHQVRDAPPGSPQRDDAMLALWRLVHCPLSGVLLTEGFVASDGVVYDGRALQARRAGASHVSPVSERPLGGALYPCIVTSNIATVVQEAAVATTETPTKQEILVAWRERAPQVFTARDTAQPVRLNNPEAAGV